MSANRSSVKRLVAATGDDFSVFQHAALVDGVTLTTERVALQWAPLQVVKIANQVTTVGDYPSKGSVTITAGSGTSVTLSGALPAGAGTGVGLILLLLDVTATNNQYQAFKIIGHSSNTLTLNRSIPTALTLPADQSKFVLLIDCEGFNVLSVKAEYSANSNVCEVVPALYAGIRTLAEPTPAVRAPYRINDRIATLDNLTFQGDTEETSYYHAESHSVSCIGALGAKVRLHSISGGNVSLWAATA